MTGWTDAQRAKHQAEKAAALERARSCRWCREPIRTTPCQCAKAVDEHRRIMSGVPRG